MVQRLKVERALKEAQGMLNNAYRYYQHENWREMRTVLKMANAAMKTAYDEVKNS